MERCFGRLLLKRECEVLEQWSRAEIEALGGEVYPAIERLKASYRCGRCGNQKPELFQVNACQCAGKPCVYCLNCLGFGKVRSCDELYYFPARGVFPKSSTSLLQLSMTLSPAQERLSENLVTCLKQGQDHLLWAVTGAGKTEMLFKALDVALSQGLMVGLAAPRVDVINELKPRLQDAFPTVKSQCLYAGSPDEYQWLPLTLCSTHQLLRFKEAFDLLIIDEVDAFPFAGEATFQWAAKRAVKSTGVSFYLTATPGKEEQRQMRAGELSASILPARYHRQPLPVPKHCYVGPWRQELECGLVPGRLRQQMAQWLQKGYRFLVFLPHIALMLQLEKNLRKLWPKARFTSVSSKDPKRLAKVEAMRAETYDFLLTTTILERGVTFPNIHVLVLGSEDPIFTASALMQISGRVGRKPWAATGEILFLHYGKTRASQQAIQQIKSLNQKARKEGLLDE